MPSHVDAATAFKEGKNVKVLGSEMGGQVNVGTLPGDASATYLTLKSLGTAFRALFALTNPPNTIDGVTYTEVYSFGKRVFSNSHYFYTDGANFSVGLAPTQVRVPFVVYPVGPVSIHVDGGARFQANLSAKNMTTISFPLKYSEPGIQLTARASAAGFVEGYAAFLLLRAGVGGQLDLVDASLDVNSKFSLEGKETVINVAAIAEFLKGRLYAFLDVGFFGWGMKRLIDHDLYAWKGFCFAAGTKQCPVSRP
jgi:hypothetical protein